MLQFWQISRISAMFFCHSHHHTTNVFCVCKDCCCELKTTWPACKRLLLFYVLLFRRIFLWAQLKQYLIHFKNTDPIPLPFIKKYGSSNCYSTHKIRYFLCVASIACCRDMIFLVWNEIYYLLQLVVPEHIKVGQTKGAHEKGITFPLHSKWILWQMACNPGWIISF